MLHRFGSEDHFPKVSRTCPCVADALQLLCDAKPRKVEAWALDFVKLWTRSGKKQVIAQAEIFLVVIAKCTWQDMLRHRSVLWFLDNESARMALVRNFSAVLDSYFLLLINSRVDMQVQSRNWFSRAPSKSNPSDSASRLQFSECKNATQCSPVYDLAL